LLVAGGAVVVALVLFLGRTKQARPLLRPGRRRVSGPRGG
jgi:hypothetical protein